MNSTRGPGAERASLPGVDRILRITFATVYPLYVEKVTRKARTQDELDAVIQWLTGWDDAQLQAHIGSDATLGELFAEPVNPDASLITGVICGIRVEQIEDPVVQRIRYLDKLVDELARGKPLEKVLRTPAAVTG